MTPPRPSREINGMKTPRMIWAPVLVFVLGAALFAPLAGCGGGPGEKQGSALLVRPAGPWEAGSPGTWRVSYVVPEGGFAAGGSILVFFPHAYYNNRPANMIPQTHDPDAPGFSKARVNGKKYPLITAKVPLRPGALKLVAGEKGWKTGDRLEIAIGEDAAGGPTFQAPKAATPTFRLFVLADAAGDGKFERVPLPEPVEIFGAKAVKGQIIAPSVVSLGERFDLTVRFLDAFGNVAAPDAPVAVTLTEEITDASDGEESSAEPSFEAPEKQTVKAAWEKIPGGAFTQAGFRYFVADFGGVFPAALSNPVLVSPEKSPRRFFFGDIHAHTTFSDGLSPPEYSYDIARGPAALSFAAITDHEWQIDPDEWDQLRGFCRERNNPGSFVVLLAWEFSFGGHGIVYYDDCEAAPPLPPDGPRELWDVLANDRRPYSWTRSARGFLAGHGDKALLYDSLPKDGWLFIPHTSATADMGDDWDSFDPVTTPAVEIYSGHGSDESEESPRRVEPFVDRGSAVAALNRGFRVGFIANSDGHDSRPGLSTWGRHPGGLTVVEASALTRQTVFEAIRNGRTYATTGARILLRVTADDRPPGSAFPAGREPKVVFQAAGTAPIQAVEIIKNGTVVHAFSPEGTVKVVRGEWADEAFDEPAYVFLRVTQTDGERAWSSPFFWEHPDYARIENFAARNEGDAVVVSWKSRSGRKTEGLRLFKRLGNDGGGDPAGYVMLGTQAFPEGPIEFRDEPLDMIGTTAYYLIVEENGGGARAVGPMAAPSRLPARPVPGKGWRLGYFAPEKEGVYLRIFDTEGRTVRAFDEGVQPEGYQEVFWDATDDRGDPVTSLCFYRVRVGGHQSPRKAIMDTSPPVPSPPNVPIQEGS